MAAHLPRLGMPARSRAALVDAFAMVSATLLALLLSSSPSVAQTQRLITGSAAGAPADLLARVVSDILREETGQTWITENRPGAGNRLAAQVVKDAAAAHMDPKNYVVKALRDGTLDWLWPAAEKEGLPVYIPQNLKDKTYLFFVMQDEDGEEDGGGQEEDPDHVQASPFLGGPAL